MHSICGNQATPLTPRLTLILLANEQQDFLRRALAWYRDLPVVIKVLDASCQPFDDAAAAIGIDYQHAPELGQASVVERLNQALRDVATPYTAWAEVDSFLLPAALAEAVEFLDSHPGHGACQGYSLTYEARVGRVDYLLRDRRVLDDHDIADPATRVERFMAQSVSLQHAVTRTALLRGWLGTLPGDVQSHWYEIGLSLYLSSVAQVRILPVPYALHLNHVTTHAEHLAALHGAVVHIDPKARAQREDCVALVIKALGVSAEQSAESLKAGLAAMAEGLKKRSCQGKEKLVSSVWNVALEVAEPQFEPRQYVELPFYTQAFYDELARIEFLIHAMPAGQVQLRELEAVLLRQAELSAPQSNPDAEPLLDRLWQAYALYAFNGGIVRRLEQELPNSPSTQEEDLLEQIERVSAWAQRLRSVTVQDNGALLGDMPSGRLLKWLDSRAPDAATLKKLVARQATRPEGSQITVLLLDLEADIFKLQATFDSLINSYYRNFKVIVFTVGELPATTTLQHTLHFVRVTPSNYVDRINQILKQSTGDWLMLARAGEQFTATGLLLASDELIDAGHCRAVAVDRIERQADGTLESVLLPDFNLDLLQSVPGYVARHWLIRRTALLEAGGYSRDYPQALEFDLLLRLIEQGGMQGLAHLSEPVVICQASELVVNEDEKKVLTRHLKTRGYLAEVSPVLAGSWKIDYRHEHRPMVSILVHAQDNLADLQKCLGNLLQRTRYPRYEVLIGDNNSRSAEVFAWLEQQEKLSSRIRVFRADQSMSSTAMLNQLSQQAQGEYLIVLDAQSQIINVGWIESLLNQAQRPEVGIVGAKLVDREGSVTQAGLILGFNGSVGSAFVGEANKAQGYMQRLVVEQNYSAVSMNCLMIDKALFNAIDGLDEGDFAQAFADVDLCLKAAQAGYLTVWTPQVQVVHPGGVPQSAQALQALRSKWSSAFEHDAAYSRHMSLRGAGFELDSHRG